MLKAYAGIGSRDTPAEILDLMKEVAQRLVYRGWLLRSGAAAGADAAFEDGVWTALDSVAKTGEQNFSDEFYLEIFKPHQATPEAIALSSQFHPAWDKCSQYAQQCHGRNAMILLGKDLTTPANMVVCWTPGGEEVGGTGQGIRIARAYEIAIRNLGDAGTLKKVEAWLNT